MGRDGNLWECVASTMTSGHWWLLGMSDLLQREQQPHTTTSQCLPKSHPTFVQLKTLEPTTSVSVYKHKVIFCMVLIYTDFSRNAGTVLCYIWVMSKG